MLIEMPFKNITPSKSIRILFEQMGCHTTSDETAPTVEVYRVRIRLYPTPTKSESGTFSHDCLKYKGYRSRRFLGSSSCSVCRSPLLVANILKFPLVTVPDFPWIFCRNKNNWGEIPYTTFATPRPPACAGEFFYPPQISALRSVA